MFFAPKSANVRILRTPLPPCVQNVRTGQTSPLTADAYYGQRLTSYTIAS